MNPRGRPKKIRQETVTHEIREIREIQESQTSEEFPPPSPILTFVERIEVQEDEKTIAQKTILDIYMQAKEQGIEPRILREIIRLRKLSPHERAAYLATRDQYLQASGLTP